MASPDNTTVREHPAAAYHARRRSEVDAKILKTARTILNDEGLAALTVERVAAESGVAKTTIYRRFKHRLDLATAAIAELPQAFLDEGPADIQEWLKLVILGMKMGLDTRSAEVIGAGLMYRHDVEFSRLYRERMVEARADAVRPRLQKAIDAGEIRGDVDINVLMATVGGAVVGCQLNGTVENEGWIDDIMKLVWSAFKPQ